MKVKQRLVEALGEMLDFGQGTLYTMADRLIAKGVTIPVSGEWIEDYEVFIDDSGRESFPIHTGYVCSECDKEGSPYWAFCPHCGSPMLGGNKS